MADNTLYDTTAPSEGSLALAHEQLIRLRMGGTFINMTGDVNNLNLNPTDIPVSREVYGTKGRPSQQVIGRSYAPTFDVEVVRDPVTKQIVAAQAWLKDLVKAAFSTGAENLREFQIFTDALDEDMPVLQGKFSVSLSGGNAGYADKRVMSFTLASDGVVPEIDSPLRSGGAPIIESATPAGLTVGDQIVLRGYKFTGTTGVSMDAATVTEFVVVDDYTLVLVIPATVAGAAPVIVTNSVGPSTAFAYTAA